MRDTDHGRAGHALGANRDILDLDRGNPFAAGFDHVLSAVGDLHVAEFVERSHIAGVEKTVWLEAIAVIVARAGVFEIGPRHGGATHHQAPERLAVMRFLGAFIIDDF